MITDPEQYVPVETHEGEYVLPLRSIFRIIWRRLWIIALVVVLLTGIVVGFNLRQTPQYEASINIFVGQEGGLVVGSANQPSAFQDLTQTLAIVVPDSRTVAEAAVREQDLSVTPDELLGSLNAEALPESQIVEVSYTNSDPELAARAVNAFGSAFSERISEINPSNSDVTATVWEQAEVPTDPVSPQPLLNGLFALAAGIILGIVLAFLVEYLDDSWRSPEEAERVSGVPTFGVIPEFTAQKAKEKA